MKNPKISKNMQQCHNINVMELVGLFFYDRVMALLGFPIHMYFIASRKII